MTVRPLRLLEGNDETINVAIMGPSGGPLDLTDAVVEMIIKSAVGDVEGTYPHASVVVLSTATGEIEVTSAAGGTVVIDINSADLAAPGERVYRVDVIDDTGRRTAVYGDLTVTNL